MNDNEFLLFDRKQKIQQVIKKYGEENFYISFSGGKDSTVLSWLIDYSLPGNKIPRVYADTGIELTMIRDFVLDLAKEDERIVIIKPSVPIKQMLEKDGYPFKSKMHSKYLMQYQKGGLENYKSVRAYLGIEKTLKGKDIFRPCPKILKHQFSKEYNLKVSDKCCKNLKENPLSLWQKENSKIYGIVGIMKIEGGRRSIANCLTFSGKKLKSFQPMAIVSKEWESWLIESKGIKICDIYNPPYNFERTGCKGCPFALNLQNELDTLEKYFPNERKQCEAIWKPVYEEYRQLGYRLKREDHECGINGQVTLSDYKDIKQTAKELADGKRK